MLPLIIDPIQFKSPLVFPLGVEGVKETLERSRPAWAGKKFQTTFVRMRNVNAAVYSEKEQYFMVIEEYAISKQGTYAIINYLTGIKFEKYLDTGFDKFDGRDLTCTDEKNNDAIKKLTSYSRN